MARVGISNVIEGVNSVRLTRVVTLTAAQVRALNATVREIIPDPGDGYVIQIDSASALMQAGTAFAGVAAAEDIRLRYANATGATLATFETVGWLTLATIAARQAQVNTGGATLDYVSSARVVLHNSGAVTGGRAITFTVNYYINRA